MAGADGSWQTSCLSEGEAEGVCYGVHNLLVLHLLVAVRRRQGSAYAVIIDQ